MCSCCRAFLCPFFGFGAGGTCGENESDMMRRHLDNREMLESIVKDIKPALTVKS